MAPVRVLLVNDHTIFRQVLCSQCAKSEALEFAEEAVSGTEAVQKCRSLRPEVVLTDLKMLG